jgi:hypothetical protein
VHQHSGAGHGRPVGPRQPERQGHERGQTRADGTPPGRAGRSPATVVPAAGTRRAPATASGTAPRP